MKTIASAKAGTPPEGLTLMEWAAWRAKEDARIMADVQEQLNEFVEQQRRLAMLDPDDATEH